MGIQGGRFEAFAALALPRPAVSAGSKVPQVTASPFRPAPSGRRIVICDYNALLLSVTGLLRMAGYRVFQAHDGHAADELCIALSDISLLILNTEGTGLDIKGLIENVRDHVPGLPVLHIGATVPPGLPEDVPSLDEGFSPERLLTTVEALIKDPISALVSGAAHSP